LMIEVVLYIAIDWIDEDNGPAAITHFQFQFSIAMDLLSIPW